MNLIDQQYEKYLNVSPTSGERGCDISEHLPTLFRYATECKHITEMGVRYMVSLWALLKGKPTKLIAYDIASPSRFGETISIEEVKEAAKLNETDFQFYIDNSLGVDIEETDLLFVDTLHNYTQLKYELKRHADKVRKYIILHDTVTYGMVGEMFEERGLRQAIYEFLSDRPEWSVKEHFENCNGLTILVRN